MFPQKFLKNSLSRRFSRVRRNVAPVALAVVLLLAAVALLGPGSARAQSSSASQDKKPTQTAPPEAGGPTGDVGPIAVPRKGEEPPPAPPRRTPAAERTPEYSLSVNVPLVTLDVMVTAKDGHFIPGLKKEFFRIYEDGVPQKVSNFSQGEAPITAVLLVEFASNNYGFMLNDVLNASYNFAASLKKEDWVAVVSYDMKPEILVDFTQDKRAIYAALNSLRIPGFRETNLFDALYDTIDRIEGIEGRKYIILVSTGCDSFSKLTYDKILKKVQATQNISIYAIGVGQALREWADARGLTSYYLNCTGGPGDNTTTRIDFLQADNQMSTFARLTGGRAYFPRFQGQFPEIFADIGNSIRNEYTLAYHPTNPKLDGTYRKLKVELVDENGQPLKMRDEKGKEVKYTVIAREGYTAKHTVE